MGTNVFINTIPTGTGQADVERRIGKPCSVIEGCFLRTTNSAGIEINSPADVWRYVCTNGIMLIGFDTNKTVKCIVEDPAISI
jgi:hypothetical protein